MSLLGNSNEDETFTTLFKNIENDLFNITKNKVSNPSDVDDVMQETVAKAFKNFRSLKNKKYFKTWIVSILLNECNKNYYKKHKDLLLLEKIITMENFNLEDSSISDFEDNLHFKELLNDFSATDKDIFIFYYQCNYSIKDIANILQINESTIKSKIKRNKEKLEKIMKGGSI